MFKMLLLAVALLCVRTPLVHADEVHHLDIPGLRYAQFDADDTYDPFADYSEFDEAQEEEADINFFRNGRFVTLGFMGGLRGFTNGSSQLYSPGANFGLFLSYFFDLRFALQFSFLTSSHSFNATAGSQTASGTVSFTSFGADLKYYFNTQNVTKGLARFNPYVIGGFAQVDRTVSVNNLVGYAKEGAMGVDLGAGIEIPMLRNKMYFGGQALYQMTNFPDSNTPLTFGNGQSSSVSPNGGSYTLMAILGINF